MIGLKGILTNQLLLYPPKNNYHCFVDAGNTITLQLCCCSDRYVESHFIWLKMGILNKSDECEKNTLHLHQIFTFISFVQDAQFLSNFDPDSDQAELYKWWGRRKKPKKKLPALFFKPIILDFITSFQHWWGALGWPKL